MYAINRKKTVRPIYIYTYTDVIPHSMCKQAIVREYTYVYVCV